MSVMLYRRGAEPNPAAWGENLETCIVDEGDLDVVMADGWFRHPRDIDAAEVAAVAAKTAKTAAKPAEPPVTPDPAEDDPQ
jgi:hypothetical protein